jgi:hypothetical protein
MVTGICYAPEGGGARVPPGAASDPALRCDRYALSDVPFLLTAGRDERTLIRVADTTRARVFTLHVQGLNHTEIAKRLEISRERVRQVVDALATPPTKRGPRLKSIKVGWLMRH